MAAVRGNFLKVALIDARDCRVSISTLEELRAEEIPLVVVNASDDATEALRGLGSLVRCGEPAERVVAAVHDAAHGDVARPERNR